MFKGALAALAADEPVKEKASKPAQAPPRLRYFHAQVAAMPTDLTHTALFGLPGKTKRSERPELNDHQLPSRRDIALHYTGQRLDQGDADVWYAILRLARGKPLGERVYTSYAELLRELGRAQAGPNRDWLRAALQRLSTARLRLQRYYNGRLIDWLNCGLLNAGADERTGQLWVRLDPDGSELFANLAYAGWALRLGLRSTLAKALLTYATGYEIGKPHAVSLTSLAALTGYTGRLRQFRDELKSALTALEAAGFFELGSAVITDHGTVRWTRTRPPEERG